ncbi:MAG: hypothetical protein QXS85_05200 [Acidilobaceae archaeon]
MSSEEEVILKVRISRSEYEKLRALAESEGYATVPEYVRGVLRALAEGRRLERGAGGDLEQTYRRMERFIADLLNPFTAKVDEVLRRLSQIQEVLESSGRLHEESKQELETHPATVRRALTAVDRLKKEGVVFSEDVKWLRAPERFFEKLKREGAVVIERGQERIAVDRDFWKRFLEEVGNISVSSVDEASELAGIALGESGSKLFKKLARLGLLVYDEDEARWVSRVSES